MISLVAAWVAFALGAAAMTVGVLGALVAAARGSNGGGAGFIGFFGAAGLGVLGLLTSIGVLLATGFTSRGWWGLGLSVGAPMVTAVLIFVFVPRGAFRL